MNRDEFDSAFWFHGKGQAHPLYGQDKITGGVARDFRLAAGYADQGKGSIDLIRESNLPAGAKTELAENPSSRTISAMGIEPGKAEFSIPASVKDPYQYLVDQGKIIEKPPTYTTETGQTLQAVAIPGLKEFVEQDLSPATKSFLSGAKETAKGILHFLAPRVGVKREPLDLIMKMKGERDMAEYRFELATKDMEKMFSKLTVGEQVLFIDNMKRGNPQASPVLQQIADYLRQVDTATWTEANKLNPSLSWLDNHFRVLWKIIPGRAGEEGKGVGFRRPLEGSKGFFKQHTLDDMSEGIALGGIPRTYNPVTMFKMAFGDMQKYITVRRMWQGLKDIDAVKFVRFGSKRPDGFVRLDDKIAQIYVSTENYGKWEPATQTMTQLENVIRDVVTETRRQVGGTPTSAQTQKAADKAMEALLARGWSRGEADQILNAVKKSPVTEAIDRTVEREIQKIIKLEKTNPSFVPAKGVVKTGEYFVEEGAGRLLNRYLSRDYVREAAAGRAALGLKNVTTAAELSFSAFHFVFETLETAASGFALGMRKISEGVLHGNLMGIISGAKDILTAPITPLSTARLGGSAIKYVADPQAFLAESRGQNFINKFPNAGDLIADLFTGGGKLAMHQDYKINTIQTFRQALKQNNYIGAAIRGIPAFSELIMKPLFETYIPRLKIGMFLKEYSNALVERTGEINRGTLTKPELARRTWDFVEDRLGEMNFDNLFWDRTFKSSMQVLVRSITWKLGNIRGFGKAFVEQGLEFKDAFKEGRLPSLAPEMAWAWGVVTLHLALGTMIQMMATGEKPKELRDMVYPRINDDGDRLSIPTYLRDAFHLGHKPLGWAASSMSGFISRFTEVIKNKDFYGTEVYSPEESYTKNAVDALIHIAPLPFSVSSAAKMKSKGETPMKQGAGFLGFTKAPYYIEQSKAQQLAYDLMGEYLPEKPRTKQEFERAKKIKDYSDQFKVAIRRNDETKKTEIINGLQADTVSGKLYMSDIDKFVRKIGGEPLENTVKKLQLKDAMQVWNVASPEEKEKLTLIMADKIIGLASDHPEEYQHLAPRIEAILNEIEKKQKYAKTAK